MGARRHKRKLAETTMSGKQKFPGNFLRAAEGNKKTLQEEKQNI